LISEHLLSRARQRAVLSYVKRAEPPKRLSTRLLVDCSRNTTESWAWEATNP